MIGKSGVVFFTTGFEGRDIDEYVQVVEKDMVKVVVDVRRNPISNARIQSVGEVLLDLTGFEEVQLMELS